MNLRLPFVTPFVVLTVSALAADLPAIPAQSIARKKELLFADDFEGAQSAKAWHKVVPTFMIEKGTLKGTQTRDKDIPATDGKPAVKVSLAG